ncbi:MAG: hypothetical protein ACRCZF_12340, partial [Gemmataceae bacterium]
GVVLDHWVTPNFGRSREHIPGWASALITRFGLDPDGLMNRLTSAADALTGATVEHILSTIAAPVSPKPGWRSKLPDLNALVQALAQFDALVGAPVASSNRTPTNVEDAIRAAGYDVVEAAQNELTHAITALVDDPVFRLAGAEEAARHLYSGFDRGKAEFNATADTSERIARDGYEMLVAISKGRARAPSIEEFTEAVQSYPQHQFHTQIARRCAKIYEHLKSVTAQVLGEVTACRQRIEGFNAQIISELEAPCPAPGLKQVLPPNCSSIEEAAQKFLAVLTDDDLAELENRIQAAVEAHTGGLYQACLNTAGGTEQLYATLREQTRIYLNQRLGAVDFPAMMFAHFGGTAATHQLITQAFDDARPELIGNGPWAKQEVAIVATPPGDTAEALRHSAGRQAEDLPLAVADTTDEILIYREFPYVPISTLPQTGPHWAKAHEFAPEMQLSSPHARLDVEPWTSIDEE